MGKIIARPTSKNVSWLQFSWPTLYCPRCWKERKCISVHVATVVCPSYGENILPVYCIVL